MYSAGLHSSLVFLAETMTTQSLVANVNCRDLNFPLLEHARGRIMESVTKCMKSICRCDNSEVECQELPLWLGMIFKEGMLRKAREKPLGQAESVRGKIYSNAMNSNSTRLFFVVLFRSTWNCFRAISTNVFFRMYSYLCLFRRLLFYVLLNSIFRRISYVFVDISY